MTGKAGFERTINKKTTVFIQLRNSKGLEALISNYGARIIALNFKGTNVTPDFSSLDPYTSTAPYHGATIGRYANRIANGKFTLHGKEYNLPVNNPPNHLHGGPGGFRSQVWDEVTTTENEVALTYFSKDGEEGYPGNVTVTVTFTLSNDNEIIIQYNAKTDADTPFNITNHSYFNLNGDGTILHHQLQVNADSYTPVDNLLIPTGEIRTVANTALDFRLLKNIGTDIDSEEEQIKIGKGYDHNFVLNKGNERSSFAAKAIGDRSGIVMEVFTEEPGMQLFSGNFEATNGDPSTFRNTFCLETQHFPDSPNQSHFPNTILEIGETFTSKTIYKFSL